MSSARWGGGDSFVLYPETEVCPARPCAYALRAYTSTRPRAIWRRYGPASCLTPQSRVHESTSLLMSCTAHVQHLGGGVCWESAGWRICKVRVGGGKGVQRVPRDMQGPLCRGASPPGGERIPATARRSLPPHVKAPIRVCGGTRVGAEIHSSLQGGWLP